MRRPYSYSEGFITIPDGATARGALSLYPPLSPMPLRAISSLEDLGAPMLEDEQRTPSPPLHSQSRPIPRVPSAPFYIEVPGGGQTSTSPPRRPATPTATATTATSWCPPWPYTAHSWALRLSLHLVLISVFETLFFWFFVSKSEDTALIGLVNTYMEGVLNTCTNMTQADRAITNYVFDALFNVTDIDEAGVNAASDRTAFNDALLGTSWTYFGTILGIFTGLVVTTRFSPEPRRFRWRGIVGENVALIVLLGLYEWMFFHTIVFRYRAISMAELDRMIVTEFGTTCGLTFTTAAVAAIPRW